MATKETMGTWKQWEREKTYAYPEDTLTSGEESKEVKRTPKGKCVMDLEPLDPSDRAVGERTNE